MSNTESEDTEVDYQLGAHKLDTSGSIVDDEDVIEFDFESGAVFRRLADDIYESPEAGIREPLTNAITTVRRVFGDSDDDGVIKITVQDGDQVMLRLRDNGEGISKAVLEEVLTVIGRSNARDDGELSGQYGMGFLASYKLVGMNGGFLMCTNSRDTDNGPYSGLFKPGTFEPDKDNSLPQLLDEDEYGTVFEYYLSDDISIKQIREWVDKHSRWSPVPIIYKEIDEDGTEKYNEDYHADNIEDKYGEAPSLQVENEYYEAATSPDSMNDIVLISAPVSMRGTRSLRQKLPWQVDLRLKYENGIVFKGPNKGKVPVSEEEYEDMDESRQNKYILESDLEEDDMRLPEPTGTRETLRRHRDFLKYVNNKLVDKYLDEVEHTLDNFTPEDMSMQDMSEMSRHIMLRIFSDFDDSEDYETYDISRKLNREYNYDTENENLLEFIQTMTENISVVSEDKGHSKRYPRYPAYKLQEDSGEVFMCVSQNSWKATAVERSDNETHIVKVEQSSDYEAFEKHLNWSKLKSIKKSNATEVLEIGEDQIKKITSSNSKKADETSERKLTVHIQSGGRTTRKRTAEKLVEYYADNNSRNGRFGDVLVLYPKIEGENVSDNYHLADNRCCVASCGSKLSEYLTKNAENIVMYDEYQDWVKSHTIKCSDGVLTLENALRSGDNIFYVTESHYDGVLNNIQILRILEEQFEDRKSTYTDVSVCLIDKKTWNHLNNLDDPNITSVISTPNCNPTRYGNNIERCNLAELFIDGYLTEDIKKVDEFMAIKDEYNNISKNLIVNCEILMKISEHDKAEFVSQTTDGINKRFTLPKHKTVDGDMNIDEIYNHYSPENVVIHVLSSKEIDHFKDAEFMEKAPNSLSNRKIGRHEIPNIDKNGLYVPILDDEYNKINEYIDSKSVVLGKWNRNDERTFDIKPKYIYATVKIRSWEGENVRKLIANQDLDKALQIVESVSKLPETEIPSYDIETSEVISMIDNRN
jgi:hypothetical protein